MCLTRTKLTPPAYVCKHLPLYSANAFGGIASADRRNGLAVFAGARP
jgi:hypothetical protein